MRAMAIKTLKEWQESDSRDWCEYCQPGDEIDREAYDYFLNVLPPRTLEYGYFQVGEPHSHRQDKDGKVKATYPTFGESEHEDGSKKYLYLGNCFAGKWENVV